eukprot:12922587-Prorocentrum_lima.AAC.1
MILSGVARSFSKRLLCRSVTTGSSVSRPLLCMPGTANSSILYPLLGVSPPLGEFGTACCGDAGLLHY